MSVSQGELFAPVSYVLKPSLISDDGSPPFILIGCGREKLLSAAPAAELYTSQRFQGCLQLARTLSAPFAILSAKHGVVPPDRILDPYDLNIVELESAKRRKWAQSVIKTLQSKIAGKRVVMLATSDYLKPILDLASERGQQLEFVTPWSGFEKPDVMGWLLQANRMAERIRDLRRFYAWVGRKRKNDEIFRFGTLATRSVPPRGVYVFLDSEEPNFCGDGARIVRIGTHAVSLNSKATLRGRLRNHLGPANEIGNHRGSIFRLHVGRAMLEAENRQKSLPTWGEGQDANQAVKTKEAAHELAVSRYLQRLEVALIKIDDAPTKDSLRAKVEAQLIALCTERLQTIDCPSWDWLGRWSPVEPIRQSGLWNIRGVGGKYEPAEPGSVESIIQD